MLTLVMVGLVINNVCWLCVAELSVLCVTSRPTSGDNFWLTGMVSRLPLII